jgi:hypothetical protein
MAIIHGVGRNRGGRSGAGRAGTPAAPVFTRTIGREGHAGARGSSAMATDRDVEETVCRCLSLVIYFHHFEKRRTTRPAMAVEVRAVADQARKLGIPDHAILPRVDAELAHRFDDATRRRLHAEFATAYRRTAEVALPSLAVR